MDVIPYETSRNSVIILPNNPSGSVSDPHVTVTHQSRCPKPAISQGRGTGGGDGTGTEVEAAGFGGAIPPPLFA